jgi:predicted GIY-YIG superfamily endonuclease
MFVYSIDDPTKDYIPFYVGITIDLYERFKQHMRCDGTNVQKDRRIQEILAAGHLPIMRTIEQTEPFGEALEREAYWIIHYLNQGVVLTNLSGVPADRCLPIVKKERPKQRLDLIDLMDLKSYRLGKTELNARHCTFDEFVSFARSLVQIADTGNVRTVFQRRDFLNWCLQEGILRVEDDKLVPNVET